MKLLKGISIWLVLFLAAGSAFAGSHHLNNVRLAESYTEKVIALKEGNTTRYQKVGQDVFSITVKLPPGEPSTGCMCFECFFGGLELTHDFFAEPGPVSDLKKFTTWKETFTMTVAGKKTWSRIVRVQWRSGGNTVTITGRTLDTAARDWASIHAPDLVGNPSGVLHHTVSGQVTLGSERVLFNSVPVTGKIKVRNTTAKDGSVFTLHTISYKGTVTE